jgi:hypothetical protein
VDPCTHLPVLGLLTGRARPDRHPLPPRGQGPIPGVDGPRQTTGPCPSPKKYPRPTCVTNISRASPVLGTAANQAAVRLPAVPRSATTISAPSRRHLCRATGSAWPDPGSGENCRTYITAAVRAFSLMYLVAQRVGGRGRGRAGQLSPEATGITPAGSTATLPSMVVCRKSGLRWDDPRLTSVRGPDRRGLQVPGLSASRLSTNASSRPGGIRASRPRVPFTPCAGTRDHLLPPGATGYVQHARLTPPCLLAPRRPLVQPAPRRRSRPRRCRTHPTGLPPIPRPTLRPPPSSPVTSIPRRPRHRLRTAQRSMAGIPITLTAFNNAGPAWFRLSVTSGIWCLLRPWSYTVEMALSHFRW